MKKAIFFLAVMTVIAISSCKPNADNIIEIFNDGISAAQNATSLQELHEITVDVKNRLTKEGQKFNGDKKMGVEETRKALNAQEHYYQAIESASIRLGGGKGGWYNPTE